MADGPIRVRHLLKGLGPGGAERLVVTQITGSRAEPADDGIHYDVAYLLAHKNHFVLELDRVGVAARCLRARGAWRPGWVVRLRRLLRDDPVDIVHVHSPVVAAATRAIVRTIPPRRRPVVVGTEHNRWPRHRRLTRWANQATIRWQDATIAVSADVKSTMSAAAADRTEIVVHGIDLDRVRASGDRVGARTELGVADEEILVVCIANLRPEKALEVLIAAAERAIRDEPRLRYALVGQGPLADELAEMVARSPVESRFYLLGYRSDATRILSGADLFTLSSRHEGLPVVVMEALALGVPVAATAAGGIPQAIGMAGVTVPVDDHEALAAAHVELARDRSRRAELAQMTASEADRFSAERVIATIEGIYDTALTEAGRDRSPRSPSSQS